MKAFLSSSFFFSTLPPIIGEALKFPKGNRHRLICKFLLTYPFIIDSLVIMVLLIEDWRVTAEKEKKAAGPLKRSPYGKYNHAVGLVTLRRLLPPLRYLDGSQERGRQEI